VIYCVRQAEAPPPPDGTAPGAVPVMREMGAGDLARAIRPDGMLAFQFDGLRVLVPLPPLAPALLRLIDGQRTVAAITAAMAGRAAPDAVARAWRTTYETLSSLNRVLLSPP
jgi:hypothetical protein